MNLLLDTHVWIWSQQEPGRLGQETRALLLDEANTLFVSTTSTLELARLLALDRIRLTMELAAWVEGSLRFLAGVTLPITHQVAIEAYRLPPPFHRDPADRLLVATARIHNLRLMTADDSLLRYPGVLSFDARG